MDEWMDGQTDKWTDAWMSWTGPEPRPPASKAGLSLFQVVVGLTGLGTGPGQGLEDSVGTCLLGNAWVLVLLTEISPCIPVPPLEISQAWPWLTRPLRLPQAAHFGFQPVAEGLERKLQGEGSPTGLH